MDKIIYGRNPEQIADDDLTNTHSECEKALKDHYWSSGRVYQTYTGKRREDLIKFKGRLEEAILNGKPSAPSSISYGYLLNHIMFGRRD